MGWKKLRTIVSAALVVFALNSPGFAETGVPMVSGSIIRDYLRITFQWPHTVLFRSETSGNKIIIHFDRTANPDFNAVLSRLHPYITRADLSGDKKTVVFTMNKPYRTRSFLSGNTAGLDVLNVDTSKAEPLPVRKAAAKEAVKTPLPVKTIEKKDAHIIRTADKKMATIRPPKAKPAAIAKTASIVKHVEPPKKAEIAKKDEKPTVAVKQVAEKSPPKKEVEPVVEAAAKPSPAAPAPKAGVATEIAAEAPSTNAAGEMLVHTEETRSGFVLHFPWTKRVASAVFTNGNSLWVVFSDRSKFNFVQFAATHQPYLGEPEVTSAGAYSIVRFPVLNRFYTKVSRKDKNFDWQIEISSVPRHLAQSVPITTETTPPLKPHVILSVLEFADPVTVLDPAQGVSLIITPLFKPGVGVSPQRRFVEATIMVSAQGVVVKKNTDDAKVALLRDGLRLSSPEGITLTPGLPQLEPEIAMSADDSLFPYDKWKPSADDKFVKEMEALREGSSKATSETVSRIRLRMAQMYLAQGYDAEALGMLNLIRDTDPEFYLDKHLNALSGAANFLMYRIGEAATNFAAPELEGMPEIEMWQNMCNELLGSESKHFDYRTNDKPFISKYPPAFRQKLAVIAADLSINRKDFNGALRIFDSLNNDREMKPVQKYVDFMIATISAATGQYAAAQSIWEKMSKNYDDRFMRARAEFSLVGMLIKEGKIPTADAIRRLDHLRIVWRDDNFELNLLSLLAQMYSDNKDYIDALRTWREIVTVFPQLTDATAAAQKMAETFAYLFNQGGADAMKPLDALALYYEFPELMPLGKAGDLAKENIAEKLAQVDLIDKAADMLSNLVQFRLDGMDRSRVGTKLALFYLLNHQPQQALDTLQGTGYGGLPAELRDTRNHLSAQAFTDLGRYNEALATLANDNSPDALALKMNVYWEKKDWQNVIALGEQVLGTRKDITAKLSADETDYLVKLALAYSFVGDRVQMQYLRDYFGPLLTDGTQKDMFLFITRAEAPLDTRNFASIATDVNNIQNFLDHMRNQVKQGNLDSVVQ